MDPDASFSEQSRAGALGFSAQGTLRGGSNDGTLAISA